MSNTMMIMKLNEWKCGMDIDDASVYVEPTGILKDMVEYFKLKYNPSTESYDCEGDVNLYSYYYDLSVIKQRAFDDLFVRNGKMTIKFGKVNGYFKLPGNCYNAYILTSLEGCPKIVGGSFDCSYNKLTSLKGSPESVGDGFYCNNNQLTSLEGCPKNVGSDFDCGSNQLTSLEGCTESVGGNFRCYYNQLTSLEGCPKTVDGYFYCYDNKKEFMEDYVRSVCDVKNEIYV